MMKKLYAGLVIGIFMISSFLAMNMYTGTSFPGFGGSETCNNCHNQPIMAKNVDASFQLGDWAGSQAAFEDNGLWSVNEVPVIQTNNRSDANLEFIKTQFLTNSTHFMAMMEIDDTTPTGTATPSTSSDKFGVIFNIDSVNFTVGDFLNYYNSSDTNLNTVLDGQMGLNDGHADLWWIDTHDTGTNTTGKALDYYITSNFLKDATSQDVSFALWYGLLATHGSTKVYGYRLWFVRSLTTSDSNDVQFHNGDAVRYAIATWDNSNNEYHHSSFDQMLVVGDEIGGMQTVTVTETQSGSSTTSGTASAFTTVFVLVGLALAIPVLSKYRRKE